MPLPLRVGDLGHYLWTLDENSRCRPESRPGFQTEQHKPAGSTRGFEEFSMQSPDDWHIPPEFQPDAKSLAYDLRQALGAVVSLRARVPADAFTAETLGTERAGQGAVIRADGLVVTIGYLIAEAEEIWLSTSEGRLVQAHGLAYDYETGFGLGQAGAPPGTSVLP